VVNNKVSERLFRLLEAGGVPTHFVERLSDREMLTKRVTIIPIEVVVRNIVAGSLAKRLGLKEGGKIEPPIV
jgi:phosphoribosylaminoimidazole-succinocarboxamide synthase